ncbi:MAG: hypothetical protein AB7E28_01315, partial [Desulfurella sp.]
MGILPLFLVVLYILVCSVFYYFNQSMIFLVFCLLSLGFLVLFGILQKQNLLKQIKIESYNLKNAFLKNERINLTN